ncbi:MULTISPECIES: TetR/AcrR family transcriptional regulator [Amycolatopsis]|uniref:TetR/AcrR family transcriptional regulator n=1 Tax=Amycolatopsis thermalba TaxID=944492 RepID=A0ABY4P4F1_9PSEU|nr:MULTISPECIES: TetR/AcrR family transcriptional regulator [Amycolatopsis]OXM73277.1 TetR family transcriptional regulator [Amycolatopsis sp. KNN50.9b]UQS27265.1 TetR/AcrR family transcriptional regulator [Amycolatopsis thermalba]
MAGRRTDTRERIQQIALDLFVEQGYEKTSLREIAEALGVTKAALYYHFRTKEDIVHSLIEDIGTSLDEIIEWARAQDDHARAREELLRRLSALIQGRFGPIMRFMQDNQPALKELHAGHVLAKRMKELFTFLVPADAAPEDQLRARLALIALMVGNSPQFLDENPSPESAEVALRVALELASPRSPGGT